MTLIDFTAPSQTEGKQALSGRQSVSTHRAATLDEEYFEKLLLHKTYSMDGNVDQFSAGSVFDIGSSGGFF